MKKILKGLTFLIGFILIFKFLTLLLVRKGNGYGTDVFDFYKQDKNSIDLLVLGSSHAYAAFNPYLIEEQTGYKSYVFATQQQPIWITYYYLKEALKYQNPKFVVLEVHMIVIDDYEYASEQVNRDAIDKMKFSKNKIDVINASIENSKDKLSYYFNIIKYHPRYKELNGIDLKTALLNYTIDNKGYIGLPNENFIFNSEDKYDNEVIEISKKNEFYYDKIVNLCKEKNINIILVKTPTSYNNEEVGKLNYISKLCYNKNILFINYIRDIDQLNLNYNEDFYDIGHLNKNGSKKMTNNFIKKLEGLA